MKKIGILMPFICLLFLIAGSLHAERIEINPGTADITATVVESSDQRTVVRFEIGAFNREAISIGGEDYFMVTCGEEGLSLNAGEPTLPHIARSIIIPDDAKMEIRILSAEYTDYPQTVAVPSKGNLLRSVNPEDVPYTFGTVYQNNEFFPTSLATIRDPYILRNYRGTVIDMFAFQCNPVEKILRVYYSVVVEIVNIGPGEINVFEGNRDDFKSVPDFEEIYQRRFLNYDSYQTRYTPVEESGEMLIITYDGFASDMTPFVEWKNQKGIKTTIVNVSTIGNNSTSIKNYVQSFYNANNLAFLLLIGDAENVATPSAYGGESDPTYALLAGSDSYPDIFVGRFSAQSSTDVQTQVTRTINYEKTPSGTDWFHKGTGIASNQGPGHYGEYDNTHMNYIRTDLLNYNYTLVDQIYDPTATASQVSTALNGGRSIVDYCGHGSYTSWSSSGFSITNVNALTNNNMLPFIHSVACVNGDFGGQTCFAEAWLRATDNGNPTGAIATYMSSINQSWSPPMDAQDETIDLLVAESKSTFGGLCFNGACRMIDINGSDGASMFNTWHIFGDPSVQVRTDDPAAITVNHNSQIDYIETEFPVEVVGVEGALCALYHNGTLYGYDYTNASGMAYIPISETMPSGAFLTLTATAYNKATVQNSVEVISVPPPVAAFGSSDPIGAAPWSIIFLDSSTNSPTSWLWNFGNGETSTAQNVFYTYYEPGTYTVSLTATNAGGSDTETKIDYVHIYGLPTADFTASPTSGNGPLTVEFTDLSEDATVWYWVFGDGGTSTLQNPIHTYNSFGDFDVTLTVANLAGSDGETKYDYISVGMSGMTLFGAPETYNPGGNAESVTANDFDGDGDIDLAVVTYYPEYMVIYYNDGNGNFTSGGNYTCGDSPYFVTSADFDENGYPDLVVANPIKWNGGYISILYNYGSYFGYNEDHYTGAWYPYSISTGDIDNDSDTDIVVVQEDGNNIVIFKNIYGYYFGDTAQYFISGYSPKSIVTADFNNDNWLDIATADWANMSIMLNNGDGTYPASTEYPTNGSEGRSICAGDFDGNGSIDVAVANTVSDNVSVFLNNGDGTFATAVLYGICNEPYGIATEDFDNDGSLDLVIANSYCSSVSVMLNNGNGTFGSATEYNTGTGTNCVISADFDNDNDNDLAVAKGYTSNNLAILPNIIDALPPAPILSYPTEGSSTTDHSPTLNWEDVTTATSYDVVLDNNSDFSSLTRSKTGLITSEWTVSPNLSDNYYYWRARSVNNYGPGPWSEANRFRVWTSSGNPSCPVLYAFDGNDFNQENPLLTACEQSNYTETVTDYYHVVKPVATENGIVRFQLREMEDEITYLQDIRLITVDHTINTKVAVSADGEIGLYKDLIAPLAAVDHLGIDRLSEVLAEDETFYTCEGPGYLIVTFPNTGNGDATFGFSAKDKVACIAIKKESDKDGPAPLTGFKVEFMDADGNWVEGPLMPSRTNHTQEMIASGLPVGTDQAEIKMRISWEGGYFTDVIQQYIPSTDTPVTKTLSVKNHSLISESNPSKNSADFDNSEPLVLVNGDIFEFSFKTDGVGSGITRDYIIQAVGRYIPDYSVFGNLIPTEFQLYSNYPNPFNPTTNIDFYLPQASDVKLDIYNILGQRVTRLIEGKVDAGMNTITWNSTDQNGNQVASGVYFYKLSVGDKSKSKRMVLVK